MISVEFTEHGIKEVKPLAVIWKNHPHWGPHNTVMFDDVRRNFIMNPQSGLRIRSYRDAHTNCSHDRELLHLIEYLELIALKENDFNKLNHNSWERYLHKHRKQLKTLKSQQKRWKNRQDNRTITNSNDHPSDVQSSSSTTVCAPVLAAAVVAADSSPSLCSPSVNEPNRISSSITIDISSSDSLISGQKRVHSDDDDGDDGSTGDNDEVIKISNEIEGVESSKPVHKTNNS
ncbi:unnamed protein product [Heterobilharzia americana]|nr:unnamed protein product [Heterobilharzia americana]